MEKDHLSPSLIVKIKFCGDQQRAGHFRIVHVKMPSRALQATFSHGKSIKGARTPQIVTFFAWTTMKKNILTIDNFRKRDSLIVGKC